MNVRFLTYSCSLLESMGSSGQIEEKALRQSVAYLKQSLEDVDVMTYSWIKGEEIVAHTLTKQVSKREALDEILVKNEFKHAKTEDDMVTYEEDEFKIRNRVTKKDKEAEKMEDE